MPIPRKEFLLDELEALSTAYQGHHSNPTRNAVTVLCLSRNTLLPIEHIDVRQEIKLRLARGESLNTIARALNNNGISGGYGSRWYAASVRAFFLRQQAGCHR